METMTRSEERELMMAVREALGYVEDSGARGCCSPSDAITKVASARNLPPEHIRRVVEAFNVSTTLAHFKEATGEDRAASFPLADADVVLSKLYPDNAQAPVKVASLLWCPGDEYYIETRDFVSPDLPAFGEHATQKRASYFPSSAATETAISAYDQQKRASDLAHDELNLLEVKLAEAVGSLAECFTGQDADLSVLPTELRPAIEELIPGHRRAGRITSAGFAPRLAYANAVRDEFISKARKCAALSADVDVATTLFTSRLSKLATMVPSVVGSAIGGALMADALEVPSGAGAASRAQEALGDPDILAARKGMEAQVMLKRLVEDDEVLRHAPPASVVEAYNEISELAPAVAQNPMLARSWLRKVVEARGVDPFDVHEIIKTDADLRKSRVYGAMERTGGRGSTEMEVAS